MFAALLDRPKYRGVLFGMSSGFQESSSVLSFVLFHDVKDLPSWPLRGVARLKRLPKVTQRHAPASGQDYCNHLLLANNAIWEGTLMRQNRANHILVFLPAKAGLAQLNAIACARPLRRRASTLYSHAPPQLHLSDLHSKLPAACPSAHILSLSIALNRNSDSPTAHA
jgi:hypothetical protein